MTPATEAPSDPDPPPGVATQAPVYLVFGMALTCFAVLYFVLRGWFSRLSREG